MFKQLTIKTRFYLFIAGLILAILLSYQFAIKNTFELFAENKAEWIKLDSIKQGSIQIQALKAKLEKMKSQIGSQTNIGLDMHQEILNSCSRYCSSNNLLIREYPDKEIIDLGNSRLEINRIVLNGSFRHALSLAYQCEKERKLGRIISVMFDKQKDIYAQKDRLLTTIYFQSIHSEQNKN